MSAFKDDHNGIGAAARPPHATSADPPQLALVDRLGEARAAANDNRRTLFFAVLGLARRHLNWILPTLALAAFSLLLLSLAPGR